MNPFSYIVVLSALARSRMKRITPLRISAASFFTREIKRREVEKRISSERHPHGFKHLSWL